MEVGLPHACPGCQRTSRWADQGEHKARGLPRPGAHGRLNRKRGDLLISAQHANAQALPSPWLLNPPPSPLSPTQEDPKYKAAMKVRNPERRLRVWASLCQTKRVCEHTGGPQPTYRLEHSTLKIMAEFPRPKADDDELASEAVQERKIVSAGTVGRGVDGAARGVGGSTHGCGSRNARRGVLWLRGAS